ncbi:uncharacterized protein LOC143907090 [Temnothorax americanus]|uniref:uncharacterized protein LOC143900529 n=1 Tax=Temnothorax americanus TaxID=1964332 RepID=UPI004068CF51
MRKRKYFTKKWICSKHFADEAFTKPLQEHLLGYSPTRTRKIHPDAIPTLHLHAVPPLTSNENVLAETMPLPVSNEVSMDVEQTPASSSTEEQTPASSSTEAIMLQIRRLEAQVAALKIPREALLCLIRTRTYIRLREMNRAIAIANHRQKKRKMSKFTNKKPVY